MDPTGHSVDAITFEILSHRLHQIAKEMGATLERVGGTVNTTQMKDYMASLYRANGDILSAGDTTGWHVACAGFAVKRILERFGDDGIYPDDIFLLNDPYLLEVIAPEGTVVNVQYPGPVSLNTTSGGSTVRYMANSALMQMLATSEKWKTEVMAINAGHRNAKHAGVNQYGRYGVSALGHGALDGSGARSFGDGVDTWGGALTCANVEWFEMNFPVLYLFRRHVKDGMGAGMFRGDAGGETAHTFHDGPEDKIKGIAYGVAGLRNSRQGIFGGYPGAPSIVVHMENTRVGEMMAKNQCPDQIADIGGTSKLLRISEFDLKKDDVLYMRVASGGGYGDPLERNPQSVLKDFINGYISKETAQQIYGVVLKEITQEMDPAATQEHRSAIRKQRLEEQA